MNITRWSVAALCGLICSANAPEVQAKKTVKKTVAKKKTAAKKAVVKSGVRYDDGIVIMSGSGSIDVGNARSVNTRDVTISKTGKFTPQTLAAIRAQSQKSADAGTATERRNASVGTRVVAARANRVRPPAFNVADTRGYAVTLDQYRGKVLVLDFWATWCPPCVEEAPEMVQLYNKYRQQGMDMVGVSLDSDIQALAEFTQKYRMPWRQIFGGKNWDSDLARLYKIRSVPCPVVIARDGTVFAYNVRGAQLEQAVVAALAER